MSELAINGGVPVRATLFPSQNTIGPLEKEAANRVLNSGILTGYQGNWSRAFYGGREVQILEEAWAEKFKVKHAIACHSCTAGLHIACGAAGLKFEPYSQQAAIVSPYSMTCSATVPMSWGAKPMFADIERDYYCISPESVISRLSERYAKVVIPVSLFGMGYDAELMNPLMKKAGVTIIEDAAQAVGATLNGKYVGTLGDIGVFSFNLGKHLTAGEGGMIVTDDDELAMRCRLLMNHAEAVVNGMYDKNIKKMIGDEFYVEESFINRYKNMFGLNLRMTEINAAIVKVQLDRMDHLVNTRIENVNYLIEGLKDIPCLEMPLLRPGATHSYYVFPMKYRVGGEHWQNWKMPHRDKFVAAVKAELKPVTDREGEGVTIGGGYIRPISNMPLFDLPLDHTPECTRQWQDELIVVYRMFGPNASRKDLSDIVNAFVKVWENREEL